MSAHTPGPWHTRFVGVEGEVRDDNGLWVARVHRRNGRREVDAECVANLAVIGAAPELLALVVDFERVAAMDFGPNRNDSLLDLASRARAAIAKARGGK